MLSTVRCLLTRLRQDSLGEAARRKIESTSKRRKEKTINNANSEKDIKSQSAFEYRLGTITGALENLISKLRVLPKDNIKLVNTIAGDLVSHIGEIMALHLLNSNIRHLEADRTPQSVILAESLDGGVEGTVSAAKIEGSYLVKILACLMHTIKIEGHTDRQATDLEALQKALVHGLLGDTQNEPPPRTHPDKVRHHGDCGKTIQPEPECDDQEDCFLSQVWELLGWDVALSHRKHSLPQCPGIVASDFVPDQ